MLMSHFEIPKSKRLFAPGGEPHMFSITYQVFSEEDTTMFASHNHEDELEISLITEGNGVRLSGEKRYSIQKGDLLIYNPGVLHEENTERGNTLNYACMIQGMKLTDLPSNVLLPEGEYPVLHTENQFEILKTLFELICLQLQERPVGFAETVNGLTYTLITVIVGLLEERRQGETKELQKKENSDRNYVCELARQYIDKNYTKEITLEKISRAVHVSSSHLSHVFKREMGYSPMQYVNMRRFGEAQFLLMSTHERITDIALKTGFESPNNFYKMFMKQMGMSPSDFRNAYKKSK